MADIYFDIPIEITNPLEQRVHDVFSVYDHRNVNMVDGKDVGEILRALGCVPTEAEVEEIVSLTQFQNHPGDVHFSNFMPVIKTWLVQKKMSPSPPEDLLEAFKFFDEKDRGYIPKEDFRMILAEYGEKMAPEEVEEMMKAAVDPLEDKVYYENFLNQLVHEPEDSIYKLATQHASPAQRKSELRRAMLMKQIQK